MTATHPTDHAPAHPVDKRKEATVLSDALCRCATSMGLSTTLIARLLNLQTSVASRVLAGTFVLRRSEEEADRWDRATLLVDLYQELWRIFHDDHEIRRWLSLYNSEIGDNPLSWIEAPARLQQLVDYVRTHSGNR